MQLALRIGKKLISSGILLRIMGESVRGGSVAVAVSASDMWQVTGDPWQVTCYMWHVTPDTWQLKNMALLLAHIEIFSVSRMHDFYSHFNGSHHKIWFADECIGLQVNRNLFIIMHMHADKWIFMQMSSYKCRWVLMNSDEFKLMQRTGD